jgi:VWFA-related protein
MRLRPLGALLLTTALSGVIVASPALVSAAGAKAQSQTQAPQQEQGQIRVGTTVVSLYATVRDNHKKIVPNLEQSDFHIFEDNVEQKVAFFSKEKTLPLTMGMLLDTSGSEEFMIGAEQQAAVQFLQRVMQKKDEAMLITFDLDIDLLADWTSDQSDLDHAIRRARINTGGGGGPVTPGPFPGSGGGGTHFYDAVYLACHDKMASEAGRKALIILTDANDEGSDMKLKDAIEAAQRADTVVHVLLVADRRFGPANYGAAKQLADETGGRAIDVHNEKDLLGAFDEISDELRSEYSLGYYPTNSKLDGTYRKIRVEVSNKDDKVLARKGYYAKQEGDGD